jgi:hypothetical protein
VLIKVPRHASLAGSRRFAANWDPWTNPKEGLVHAVAGKIGTVSLLQPGPESFRRVRSRVMATSLASLLQRGSELNMIMDRQYLKQDLLPFHVHRQKGRRRLKLKAEALRQFYSTGIPEPGTTLFHYLRESVTKTGPKRMTPRDSYCLRKDKLA